MPAECEAGGSTLHIHTDGSCRGNGTPLAVSGCGVWFGDDDPRNVSILLPVLPHTNQRAELYAVLLAMRAALVQCVLPASVNITSDSTYCVQGVTSWLPRWQAKQWCKGDGKPVANVDLWRRVWAATKTLSSRGVALRLTWTKGHAKNAGNNAADRLASSAVATACSIRGSSTRACFGTSSACTSAYTDNYAGDNL